MYYSSSNSVNDLFWMNVWIVYAESGQEAWQMQRDRATRHKYEKWLIFPK